MRELADADRIRRFMHALAGAGSAPGRVYLTGGATAVLLGWRRSTIDVDLKLVPEHDALFRAIQSLKESLQINVELASPDDFIPVSEHWADRSTFIELDGQLTFYHFDLYAQALAKIERGHSQDRQDVSTMLQLGVIDRTALREYFAAVQPGLHRYPAIDEAAFARAVAEAIRE
jgi:hypothetical protein